MQYAYAGANLTGIKAQWSLHISGLVARRIDHRPRMGLTRRMDVDIEGCVAASRARASSIVDVVEDGWLLGSQVSIKRSRHETY